MTLFLDINYNTIQNIRLVQAISESNYMISIKTIDFIKFEKLINEFGMETIPFSSYDILLSNVNISHSTPKTNFGRLEQNLIFPHRIVDKCKLMWASDRTIRYSFTGLMTKKREVRLNYFINKIYPGSKDKIKVSNKYLKKIKNIFFKSTSVKYYKIGDILLWESNVGRTFPDKSWDREYYDILSQTKFVICPNGDFIWTYRFFESILCGAIPIVEESCEIYSGYKYKRMTDDIDTYVWSEEDAKYNYNLIVERMTFNLDELNNEIEFMIKNLDG